MLQSNVAKQIVVSNNYLLIVYYGIILSISENMATISNIPPTTKTLHENDISIQYNIFLNTCRYIKDTSDIPSIATNIYKNNTTT